MILLPKNNLTFSFWKVFYSEIEITIRVYYTMDEYPQDKRSLIYDLNHVITL